MILFFLAVSITTAVSQNSTSNYCVSMDAQSRYVWRGQLLGGSNPSLQPGMCFSWEGLSIGTWGAFSFANQPVQELDLFLSYTFWKNRFTVIVTDYSFPDEQATFNYFDYKKASTSHVFEAGLSYNGEENVPISVAVYCNFAGHDLDTIGDNRFSSYAEISYNPVVSKLGVELNIFAGCALNSAEKDLIGFYGNESFACINTGIKATKSFKIGESLTLPLSTALIFNPQAKRAYLTASIGIVL
jgi:hypothetical protein